MQEPHKKGLANHLDPESCAGGRKAAGEALTGAHAGQPALTGAHAGQPWSSEITLSGVPTLYGEGEGKTGDGAPREPSDDAAESETLSMRGKLYAREPGDPNSSPADCGKGRSEKATAVRPTCTPLGSRTIPLYRRSGRTRPARLRRRRPWREGDRARERFRSLTTSRTQCRSRRVRLAMEPRLALCGERVRPERGAV
jgi:hypothetical protein